MEYQDIYFLSSHEAQKVANAQNRSSDKLKLQVCYYHGDRIETDLLNLVHLPIENLVDGLAISNYRLPTTLNTDGMNLSDDVYENVLSQFNSSLEYAGVLRRELNKHYFDLLKNCKLDFDEPLRFWLSGHSQTDVHQYVTKGIAKALKNLGYEVLYSLLHGCEADVDLKELVSFNPHVYININFMQNFLSPEVINFVWIQDTFAFDEINFNKIRTDKDHFFTLISSFDTILEKKNINFQRQSFCVNNDAYKLDNTILREKKIVFIGSSYFELIEDTDDKLDNIIEFLVKKFIEGVTFTDIYLNKISADFSIDIEYIKEILLPYIIRDYSILELVTLDTDFKIEIYGKGWDKYKSLEPFYKGFLTYGDDIANVYRSATYALCPHTLYVLQQRVLESSACGAIPVVYDCKHTTGDEPYNEGICYYKSKKDLENILVKSPNNKDLSRIVYENSYENLANKILKIIDINNG